MQTSFFKVLKGQGDKQENQEDVQIACTLIQCMHINFNSKVKVPREILKAKIMQVVYKFKINFLVLLSVFMLLYQIKEFKYDFHLLLVPFSGAAKLQKHATPIGRKFSFDVLFAIL